MPMTAIASHATSSPRTSSAKLMPRCDWWSFSVENTANATTSTASSAVTYRASRSQLSNFW